MDAGPDRGTTRILRWPPALSASILVGAPSQPMTEIYTGD